MLRSDFYNIKNFREFHQAKKKIIGHIIRFCDVAGILLRGDSMIGTYHNNAVS